MEIEQIHEDYNSQANFDMVQTEAENRQRFSNLRNRIAKIATGLVAALSFSAIAEATPASAAVSSPNTLTTLPAKADTYTTTSVWADGQIANQNQNTPDYGSSPFPNNNTTVGITGVNTPSNPFSYDIVTSTGVVINKGNNYYYGDASYLGLNAPIVGIASTPDGQGYWEAASDGGVFSFGDAQFEGSMGATKLNAPVVGIESTPDGKGYWEVASDGGVFSFGDAGFYGSLGNISLNEPIVGIAPTQDGKGYWEVASDGGVFSFGDAGFYGSLPGELAPDVQVNDIIGIGETNSKDYGYELEDSFGNEYIFSEGANPVIIPPTEIRPDVKRVGFTTFDRP